MQVKKLTYNQKQILSAHNLNADEWFFVQETEFYLKIQNKKTKIIKSVDKFRKAKRY